MSHSQRISDFTGQPSLQGTDLITIVRSGTNFKISFTDFISSLGVTGTLTPIGDPAGSPVLNQPSAGVNEVRSIETSKGIIASISAQDSIDIANDFIQGTTGIPVIKDLNAAQYLFRSIVAGTGIDVSVVGDSIQIAVVAGIRADGLLSMQGNAVGTVITSAGVYALVAGVWTVERTSQFTGTTAGRLTYNGTVASVLPVTISLTVEPVSGAEILISARHAKDGVTIVGSTREASASPGKPASITMPWQDAFNTSDFVETFVTSSTGIDVLVSSAIMRLN